MIDHAKLLESLKPAVLAAGDAIMEIHTQSVLADLKSDGSPVTEADRAAEAIILETLTDLAQGVDIISEENSNSHQIEAGERFFLVDPLDGTKEFLKENGKGAFTVNIGLIENEVPVFGIVYAPALKRMFFGSTEFGAKEMRQGEESAIQVRPIPESGAVAVASASHRDVATDQWLEDHAIHQTVAIGSSLKFCLLASGEADVYPRFGPTMEWDTAAGDAVLRAAGGKVENPDSSMFLYGKPEYRNGAFIAKGRFK